MTKCSLSAYQVRQNAIARCGCATPCARRVDRSITNNSKCKTLKTFINETMFIINMQEEIINLDKNTLEIKSRFKPYL